MQPQTSPLPAPTPPLRPAEVPARPAARPGRPRKGWYFLLALAVVVGLGFLYWLGRSASPARQAALGSAAVPVHTVAAGDVRFSIRLTGTTTPERYVLLTAPILRGGRGGSLGMGGGVSTVEDVRELLLAGADKVSMNTGAVRDPNLIREAAHRFGEQCVVVAIDANLNETMGQYEVMVKGGKVGTGLDVITWAKKAASLGAGEILLTSFRQDGTREGYDLTLTRLVADNVRIPVIASGGAGKKEHFAKVLTDGKADAALAASVFHFAETSIGQVKSYLRQRGIPVRWTGVA
ncbi:MAG: imidazole glycerol phosphate synthase cyclase subunit [Bryobacteraceae bacterium]|nr:imidazole glycerol phosphate synthase cyclase subunit [Bryobacteraceae bacterium]